MTDLFHTATAPNLLDNLQVEVEKLYTTFPPGPTAQARPNQVPFAQTPLHRIYRSRLLPLRYRRGLYRLARRTRLDISWFSPFQEYWSRVLGGRPLPSVDDFVFLKGIYRMRFQANQVPDTDDPRLHLAAWQRPEVLYQLLHLVHKESLTDYAGLLAETFRYLQPHARLLEYGCATAPITAALYEFFHPPADGRVYLADIATASFHYATYRFRQCANVTPVVLLPEDDFQLSLPEPVDAIFCITVLEHLNQPLETMRRFHHMLRPGGVLVFDYIQGEGEKLDTRHAVRERAAVFDFVEANFRLLRGTLARDRSLGITFVQKPESGLR